MTFLFPLKLTRAAVLAISCMGIGAFAQSASPSQDAGLQQPKKSPPGEPHSAGPVTMTECEGTNNCATWTFLGTQGNGQWPSGEIANLTVENFDDNTVVIRRADSTGSAAGLTAIYKGTRHGNRLGGEFTSSWPGHWESQEGNWYANIGKASEGPPPVMHWCAQHCSTWVWSGNHYVGAGTPHPELTPECGVTVESFTRDSVVMHRTDCGQYPGKAVLTGKISEQGNTIVNGTITWTYHPCCGLASGVFNAAWGTAIDSIPGSDSPAAPAPARPVVCYPWFFGIVCG